MTPLIIHSLELLRILDQEIAGRCAAIAAMRPGWPCRRGCDHCCRNLAQEPLLTRAEWERLAPYVPASGGPEDPRVCPLLDEASGACLGYEVRPIACRTYGYYAERNRGLYCGQIQEQVEAGECEGVVWGNQAAVDRRLDELGPRRPLSVWRRENVVG